MAELSFDWSEDLRKWENNGCPCKYSDCLYNYSMFCNLGVNGTMRKAYIRHNRMKNLRRYEFSCKRGNFNLLK